jgi:hypothetical protein
LLANFAVATCSAICPGHWLQVTGTVSQDRGLVSVAGSAVTEVAAPEAPPAEDEAPAEAAPLVPGEVIFSSPYEGESDVPLTSTVRIQFSRGLDPDTIADQIRVSYAGSTAADAPQPASLEFQSSYDAGTRAVRITFTQPPERFRTVHVELLDGLRTFDGAPVTPWTLTFTAGG